MSRQHGSRELLVLGRPNPIGPPHDQEVALLDITRALPGDVISVHPEKKVLLCRLDREPSLGRHAQDGHHSLGEGDRSSTPPVRGRYIPVYSVLDGRSPVHTLPDGPDTRSKLLDLHRPIVEEDDRVPRDGETALVRAAATERDRMKRRRQLREKRVHLLHLLIEEAPVHVRHLVQVRDDLPVQEHGPVLGLLEVPVPLPQVLPFDDRRRRELPLVPDDVVGLRPGR